MNGMDVNSAGENHCCLPDVVTSVSEGAEAGGEYLQKLKKHGNGRLVNLQLILFWNQICGSFLSPTSVRDCTPTGHCRAVAAVAVHPEPPLQPAIHVPVFRISCNAINGHGVGGVAVGPPDGPLLCVAVADAVADLSHVKLVQQVFVQARIFVDGVGPSAVWISDHQGANGAVQTYENKCNLLVLSP